MQSRPAGSTGNARSQQSQQQPQPLSSRQTYPSAQHQQQPNPLSGAGMQTNPSLMTTHQRPPPPTRQQQQQPPPGRQQQQPPAGRQQQQQPPPVRQQQQQAPPGRPMTAPMVSATQMAMHRTPGGATMMTSGSQMMTSGSQMMTSGSGSGMMQSMQTSQSFIQRSQMALPTTTTGGIPHPTANRHPPPTGRPPVSTTAPAAAARRSAVVMTSAATNTATAPTRPSGAPPRVQPNPLPPRRAPPQAKPQGLPKVNVPPQPSQADLAQRQFLSNKRAIELKTQQLKKSEEIHQKRAEIAQLRKDKSEEKRKESARFMHEMKNLNPTIPDEVIDFYLKKSGCDCPDRRVKRLIAVAAQRFMFGIVRDAYDYQSHSRRANKRNAGRAKDMKVVLTMKDVSYSLAQNGINVMKPEFYTNLPASNSGGD